MDRGRQGLFRGQAATKAYESPRPMARPLTFYVFLEQPSLDAVSSGIRAGRLSVAGLPHRFLALKDTVPGAHNSTWRRASTQRGHWLLLTVTFLDPLLLLDMFMRGAVVRTWRANVAGLDLHEDLPLDGRIRLHMAPLSIL